MQIKSCIIYIIHTWPKPFPRERFGCRWCSNQTIYKYFWVYSALCTFVPLLSYAFLCVLLLFWFWDFRQGIMLRWAKLWRWPENFVKWGRKELWCSTRRAFWRFLILMWFLWSDINIEVSIDAELALECPKALFPFSVASGMTLPWPSSNIL